MMEPLKCWVDETSSVDLDNGTMAARVVYSDGVDRYWLLVAGDDWDPGCACRRCAPHEQIGASVHEPHRGVTA